MRGLDRVYKVNTELKSGCFVVLKKLKFRALMGEVSVRSKRWKRGINILRKFKKLICLMLVSEKLNNIVNRKEFFRNVYVVIIISDIRRIGIFNRVVIVELFGKLWEFL